MWSSLAEVEEKLTLLVRLLARGAARELAEQAQEGDHSSKPDLSEDRS